jgi:hypothetical protein
MKAIILNIRGIKCDNPDCDYRDPMVEFHEYKDWLNKPCPKCGANLLTEKDLAALRRLIKLTAFINWLMKPFIKESQKAEKVTLLAKMNGTGKVTFRLKD